MAKNKSREEDRNQEVTTQSVFLDSYNKSIPLSFPRASLETLKQFQVLHPVLFKKGDEWSIDKHRKKLMDWLFSHSNAA